MKQASISCMVEELFCLLLHFQPLHLYSASTVVGLAVNTASKFPLPEFDAQQVFWQQIVLGGLLQ